ncbi:MAG: ABC transporter ATP-binding protein [Chlorobia bacterium]|nr:ABC transporter ATP-binding protein [Fimbriimonadaceae bacterium]
MSRADDSEERGADERKGSSAFRRLFKELRPFLGLLITCAALTIFQSAFGFVPPLILGDIVNTLQKGGSINAWFYLGAVIGFAMIQGLLGYALGVYTSLMGQKFLLVMRERLYRHMQSLPLAYFEKNQTGKLVSYVINDAGTVNNLITGSLNTLVSGAVQFAIVVIVLFAINWQMALLALSPVPFYILNFRRFLTPLQSTSEDIRARRDTMFGVMQERLAGVQVVKSFGQERRESRGFMAITRGLMGLNVKQGMLGGGLWTSADALCGIGQGLVLWYGGLLCLRGEIGAGTLVMFLMYSVTYVYGPIIQFLVAIDPITRAQNALARIFRTLDIKNSIDDKTQALPMPKIRGDVKFEDVWFEYEPDQPVIKGLNLKVKAGQMIALIGFSGSGKTTITSLLMRHYDPQSGRILVDDFDLRDVQLLSYRAQVGVVAQESILFNTTVIENIRYGRMDASDEEVERAAIAANIHDAIVELSDGYSTKIGEDGVKLSVGEKQRIAIARALLADPRILILDEATSSLDSQTEAHLQAALDNLLAGRTSFVVAHRLSTIVKADVIVVLERGEIAEQGSHGELLAKNGVYASLYQKQFSVALQASA